MDKPKSYPSTSSGNNFLAFSDGLSRVVMRTAKLTESNQAAVIKSAVKIIQNGGIVIGPTDTVYGIFCDAGDRAAIKKIFALKGRSKEKSLPIFVRDIKMARRYAYVSDAKAEFLEKVWPGAVTVVFNHKEKLPQILTPHQSKHGAGQAGGQGTIGIRIPDYPFMQELLSRIAFPLAQTSANISGHPPAKNIAEIKKYFVAVKTKPDLIIDAGEIDGQPSAVIDCTRAKPMILRTGILSFDTLNKFWDSLAEE